jgi:hypothetical protein
MLTMLAFSPHAAPAAAAAAAAATIWFRLFEM